MSGNQKLNIMGNAANEELLASEEADRGSNAMKPPTNMDETSEQKYAIRDASGNSMESYIVRIISAYILTLVLRACLATKCRSSETTSGQKT